MEEGGVGSDIRLELCEIKEIEKAERDKSESLDRNGCVCRNEFEASVTETAN